MALESCCKKTSEENNDLRKNNGPTVAAQKSALRKKAKEELKKYFSDSELAKQCAKTVADYFLESDEYKKAEIIFAYMAMPDEIDLSLIIQKSLQDGKKVAIPRMRADSCDMDFYLIDSLEERFSTENKYKIREPFVDLENDFAGSEGNAMLVENANPAEIAGRAEAAMLGEIAGRVEVATRAETAGASAEIAMQAETAKSAAEIAKTSVETATLAELAKPGLSDFTGLQRTPRKKIEVSEIPENSVFLIPGLAFNLEGARLGRGKGFYDKYLASVPAGNMIFCGVCTVNVVTKAIPTENNDFRMGYLLTEYGFVKTKKLH